MDINNLTDAQQAKILRRVLSNDKRVIRQINGSLTDCIHSHGPIHYKNINSATKRIMASLRVLIKRESSEFKGN